MTAAEPLPEPRWAIIVGGFDAGGQPLPMTFESLAEIASGGEPLVEGSGSELDGPPRLLKMARRNGVERVFVHPFLDGRDTLPTNGAIYVQQLQQKMREIGGGKRASVSRRHYPS